MYATCLFCNSALGRNEALEHFPVGRRLAFDAAKGRLWVVCPSCERWNLSPLDERWEAIEDAERLYRSTRLRAATDQIGLARLRDGTELIRIGEPLRREFAAWRYGDQFGRRRRRNLLIAGAGVGAVGALVAGGVVAGVSVAAFGSVIFKAARTAVQGSLLGTAARVRTSDNQILKVRLGHLSETIVGRGESSPISIDVKHEAGRTRFEGAEALRVASTLMPKVNRYGGTKQTIADAVESIELRNGSEGYIESIAGIASKATQPSVWGHETRENGLFGLTRVQRLAFEMALHEEGERRALEGELAELERAWRDAEEIAHIADNLLVPVSVGERIAQLRGER